MTKNKPDKRYFEYEFESDEPNLKSLIDGLNMDFVKSEKQVYKELGEELSVELIYDLWTKLQMGKKSDPKSKPLITDEKIDCFPKKIQDLIKNAILSPRSFDEELLDKVLAKQGLTWEALVRPPVGVDWYGLKKKHRGFEVWTNRYWDPDSDKHEDGEEDWNVNAYCFNDLIIPLLRTPKKLIDEFNRSKKTKGNVRKCKKCGIFFVKEKGKKRREYCSLECSNRRTSMDKDFTKIYQRIYKAFIRGVEKAKKANRSKNGFKSIEDLVWDELKNNTRYKEFTMIIEDKIGKDPWQNKKGLQ